MKSILFECNDCFRKCKLIVDEESNYPKYCPYQMLTGRGWMNKEFDWVNNIEWKKISLKEISFNKRNCNNCRFYPTTRIKLCEIQFTIVTEDNVCSDWEGVDDV